MQTQESLFFIVAYLHPWLPAPSRFYVHSNLLQTWHFRNSEPCSGSYQSPSIKNLSFPFSLHLVWTATALAALLPSCIFIVITCLLTYSTKKILSRKLSETATATLFCSLDVPLQKILYPSPILRDFARFHLVSWVLTMWVGYLFDSSISSLSMHLY